LNRLRLQPRIDRASPPGSAGTAGFTLWELLTALLIASIALGLGIPSFRQLLLDSRRTADINALVVAVQLARSETAKRARPVVLCKSVDLSSCGGNEIRYDSGWMVFVNVDDLRPPHRSAAEPLLYVHRPEIDGTISSNRALYEFRPFHRRSTNGTITFCDRRGQSEARAVILSYTGRPRVSTSGPGRPLVCAEPG
jgi:type IV fimbrial biogenesis protein FimT